MVQRSTPSRGLVRIEGELSEEVKAAEVSIEARLVDEQRELPWQRVVSAMLSADPAPTTREDGQDHFG